MTEAGANPRRRRLWKYLLFASLATLLFTAAFAWYMTTDSFQAMIRRRIVAELETMTGGRVELGSFHTTPFRLRVEIRDLTIHGNEKTGEVPYAHVERAVAEMRVISILGFEFGFNSVVLDHPVVHVIVYPDGTTNQPSPKLWQVSERNALEQIFRLSIGRLVLRRGAILWNDQTIPLDFTSEDVSAEMDYSVIHRRYFGNFLLGKVDTTFLNSRPLAWMAEAHFSLGPDSIDFGSLKMNSGRSHLEAKGSLKHFRKPEITADYDAKLDIEELAAVTRRSEPRGGIAEVQGRGTWSMQDFSGAGKVLLKDSGWHDRSIDINNVNASSQFAFSPDKFTLNQIEAHLLGGSATGNLEVTDWLENRPAKKESKSKIEQEKGVVAIKIRDLSAAKFADSVSTVAFPLRKMNLTATTSGTIDLHWRGSPKKAEVTVALDAVPPISPSSGENPLIAHGHATYHVESGELDVSDLLASSRASQLQASGKLGRSGALKLSLQTSDLGEWRSFLAGLGKPVEIPALLHGHASFNGVATGVVPDISFSGNLQAQDFDYRLPGKSPQEQLVHWDSLEANVQLSARALAIRHGVLLHGDATINFGFTGALAHWQFADENSFTARLAMHNAEISDFLPLTEYNLPATGAVNLYLQASGTRSEPQANGRVEMTGVELRGESVKRFTADLKVNRHEVQLTQIDLDYRDAKVKGGADYDFSARSFHSDLTGTNFDLGTLAAGRTARWQLGGRVDFNAHGAGTLEKPQIDAALVLHDVTVDNQQEGNFTLRATTQGEILHLSGGSEAQPPKLAIDGQIHMRDGWPSNLNLRFSHLTLNALLRPYLQDRLTGAATASGEVTVQGSLHDPRDANLTGNLSDLALDVENMKLHNQGAVEFAVSNKALRLKSFHLLGEDTDLSTEGTIQLTGDRGLDLHAHGQGNLKLLESFDPAFTSAGLVAVDMDVAGTISAPLMQGKLQISDGSIAYLDLPSAFTGINGSLTFSQNRLQIENLNAHTGGGLVAFGGTAAWINHQLNFDLSLQEKDVRLRYPQGISSTANANLRFVGNSSASTFSGDITVMKLSVMPGFDFGAYLSRSNALPVTNPTLNKIRLDVHIVTAPELQMQTAIVRLSGDADLRLRGSAAKPVLLGRAEVLEGAVSFNGAKYELERGDVTFKNPVTTTPELDLQATTHVRDYDITLSLNGEPDKLKLSYRSEPPLPEADIITLLALGRTTTESAQLQESGQSSFTQEASSAIISSALNATVTNRAQRLFGVSRIKIDPEGLNTETTLARGPAVTIEQQVSNNLTLTYSTSVEYATQQIIQVVYDLPRNISIVAIRDQDGVVSFDLKIRRRKK